ncbi:MAG: YcxB family protein [Oscillospiraceae bacterium]|nr:YcxB family protein [Oscillospiraceae bacterium]
MVSIAIFVLMFFCGVGSLVMFIFDGGESTSIFYPVFLLAMTIFFIIMPRISTRSALKNSPALFDTGLAFTFHEDYFTVLTTGMMSGTTDIRYEALYFAYQTKDSFYLYLQQKQSYLINKADFTAGTPEDFAELLKKVMPAKKYRSYN